MPDHSQGAVAAVYIQIVKEIIMPHGKRNLIYISVKKKKKKSI